MTPISFDTVRKDLASLAGKTIKSITGNDLEVLGVGSEGVRVKAGGNTGLRGWGELEILWNLLRAQPAVHVDSALKGSGTSRNQPETLLANLPYIEWARLDGSKHIVFRDSKTHRLGTLKKVSPDDLKKLEGGQALRDFALDAATLRDRAENEYGLELPLAVYQEVIAAVESGKHVILTGPPGTAKTTLAIALAEVASQAGASDGFLLTTATSDWTTYETIGGLRPAESDPGKLEFVEGHFLDSLRTRKWLVIDEFNRAEFDKALGQLFTVLSGHPVMLPYRRPGKDTYLQIVPEGHGEEGDVLPVPKSWRIVATMNVFDKFLLFQMSFALMRRFAFVEVPPPGRETLSALVQREAGGPGRAADIAMALYSSLSDPFHAGGAIKELGPALYMDVARFVRQLAEASPDGDAAEQKLAAFFGLLLPHFEGVDDLEGETLVDRLAEGLSGSQAKRLAARVNEVLGVSVAPPAAPPTEPAVDE